MHASERFHFIVLFLAQSRKNNHHGYDLHSWKSSIRFLNLQPLYYGVTHDKQDEAHAFIYCFLQVHCCCDTTDFTEIFFLFLSLLERPFTFHLAEGEVTFLSFEAHAVFLLHSYTVLFMLPCACGALISRIYNVTLILYSICATFCAS